MRGSNVESELGQGRRFLSTPRDEHYPRLMMQQQQMMPSHSMADLSLLEVLLAVNIHLAGL